MEPDDIDIGEDPILVGNVVRVLRARAEANVVGREVALELQVVINDLLEDVFLHAAGPPNDSHSNGAPIRTVPPAVSGFRT